jgi:hypothetical protein
VGLIPQAPLVVEFTGDRAAEGPMTLGQRNILQWLETTPDHRYGSLSWTLDVPPGTDLDAVAAAWRVLVTRHEGLRTRYLGGPDPRQRVRDRGELTIEVYAVGDEEPGGEPDPLEVAADLTRRLAAGPPVTGLDLPLPLRVAVATVAGRVLTGVVRYSHLAVDHQAMVVLGAEFARLVRRPGAPLPGPAPVQPLDQAAAEADPRLIPRLDAALRHWEQGLARMPPFPYPAPGGATSGDAGAVQLWSPAAALAVRHIAARTRVSGPSVVLAAICAVLARRTGYPECRFPILSGNRFDPRLATYVGTLVQATLLTVEVAGAGFDDLVRRCHAAMLNASRYGRYDAYRRADLAARIRHDRGVLLSPEPIVNNLAVPVRPPRPGTEGGLTEVAAATGRTRLRFEASAGVVTPLGFEIWAVDRVLRLRALSGDLARIGRAELEGLLAAVERLLVVAAGQELTEAELGPATGLEPFQGGPGWCRVDGWWVELAEVRRLVDAALAAGRSRVVVEDGRLVAYLAAGAGVETPQQAHARCLAALPRHPTAMTPHRYVLCAGAPDDPTDPAGWRRLPVLAAASGREGAATAGSEPPRRSVQV